VRLIWVLNARESRHKFAPQDHGLSDQLVDLFPKRVAQLADGFDIQQFDKRGNPGEAGGFKNEIIGWAKGGERGCKGDDRKFG
jgi:hypothetical protein